MPIKLQSENKDIQEKFVECNSKDQFIVKKKTEDVITPNKNIQKEILDPNTILNNTNINTNSNNQTNFQIKNDSNIISNSIRSQDINIHINNISDSNLSSINSINNLILL